MADNYPIINTISALNGDGWTAPASTMVAFWSALGGGANELTLNVFLTSDRQLVCAPQAEITTAEGLMVKIRDLTLEQVQQIDAGKSFRSEQLSDDWQPTGARGEDTPWQAKPGDKEKKLKRRVALEYPSLRDVLMTFARRIALSIVTPEDAEQAYWLELMNTIREFGLQRRISLIAKVEQAEVIRQYDPGVAITLDDRDTQLTPAVIESAKSIGCRVVLVTVEQLQALSEAERQTLFASANKAGIQWSLSSTAMPYAPTAEALAQLQNYRHKHDCSIESYLSPGTLAVSQALAPRATVFTEDFAGQSLNLRYWRAGYSHINQETKIFVDDGLFIDIASGSRYSGAAAMFVVPVHGDFDAIVSFHVRNPHQATTFEMAAIGIDPGYQQMDNTKLNTRSVNLTFDVHGAPPYASSERDQNDGFRCGWNNSFNLTQFGDPEVNSVEARWYASSVNMYNKYGRDVGDGSPDNLSGQLRLVRCGPVFNTYYRDKHNPEWVSSGSVLVAAMPGDSFIRLAAKHWHKIDPAPDNTVKFWDFRLRQP